MATIYLGLRVVIMDIFRFMTAGTPPRSAPQEEIRWDVVNLTGKTIHFVAVEDGRLVAGHALESSGPVPICGTEYHGPHDVIVTSGNVTVPVLRTFELEVKSVVRFLRDYKPNTLLVVSQAVARALPERKDLMILGKRACHEEVLGAVSGTHYYHGIVDPAENGDIADPEENGDSSDDDE